MRQHGRRDAAADAGIAGGVERDAGLQKPFQLRIGINTGYCTVGNFGSEDRMDYTIIGSQVNLASRLQSHAELGSILMSHETYSLVKDMVLAEELDPIHAKGIAKPVRNYKVLERIDDMVGQGKVIREEQEGLRVLLDLQRLDGEGRSRLWTTSSRASGPERRSGLPTPAATARSRLAIATRSKGRSEQELRRSIYFTRSCKHVRSQIKRASMVARKARCCSASSPALIARASSSDIPAMSSQVTLAPGS